MTDEYEKVAREIGEKVFGNKDERINTNFRKYMRTYQRASLYVYLIEYFKRADECPIDAMTLRKWTSIRLRTVYEFLDDLSSMGLLEKESGSKPTFFRPNMKKLLELYHFAKTTLNEKEPEIYEKLKKEFWSSNDTSES